METCDVQDGNFCTEQSVEAEVQNDCLGWEEQMNYMKGIFFPNTFLKIPKQKLKNLFSKSDWIFLPISFLNCFLLYLYLLLNRHCHCLFKSVFKIQISESNFSTQNCILTGSHSVAFFKKNHSKFFEKPTKVFSLEGIQKIILLLESATCSYWLIFCGGYIP